MEEEQFAIFTEIYNTVKNKICELTAIRALTRHIPSEETRASLCKGASQTIEQLEGELDAKLGMKPEAAQRV